MGELFNPGCSGAGGAGCECEDCEEWRRYCYWNHDHGDGCKKQFLLFASDNKDCQCIPWEVSSQLRNMIPTSEPIKLETPDGHAYNVGFIKFSLITLTTGWQGFVDANHIRQGDPMLFVYCGNSTFKVRVFDSSGRDKLLSCSQPPCDHHVLNVTSLSSEDNEVTNKSYEDEVIDLSCDDDEVVGEDTTTSRREQRPLRSCRAKAEKMASTSCPSTKSGYKAGNSNEADLETHVSNKSYILPKFGANLSNPQQEEKVKEKVRAIGSEFPVFVKVMTSRSIGRHGQLRLCSEYASACCLPLEQTPLLLRLEGTDMEWPSTLRVDKYTKGRWISSFWNDLVLEAGEARGRHLPRRTGRQEQREAHDEGPSDPQVGNAALVS